MHAELPRTCLSFLFAVSVALLGTSVSRADDWPGWRGPTGMGHTAERDLPLEWSRKTGKNILWKTQLHGGSKNNPDFTSPGWSSPIVWGDRVFLTTAIWPMGLTDKERRASIAEHHVLCFRVKDGELLWDTVVPKGPVLVENVYHGYAVPTPVTDGKRVYALFTSAMIAALDFDGKILWREELPRLKDVDQNGICSSPVLYDGTVIVPSIDSAGLRALDTATGKVKWEQKTKSHNTMSTPLVLWLKSKSQLIHYAGGIQGLDPATGEFIWSCRAPTAQSSPVFGEGLLYADQGRGGDTGVAVVPAGMGDVTKTHVKWQAKVKGAAASSAIIVGDYIYRVSDPGLIKCLKLSNGESVFEERAQRISPSASPVASPDGRIYFACSGRTFVIQSGPEFSILATNDLDDGNDYTSMAVANGRLFIKGKSFLWCVGTK